MRERIADRLYTEAQKNPEITKQISLLSKASITTIDSFCLRVVRENFFKLDLDPNFRIGDTSECEILKLEALDELLEEKYDEMSADFENVFNAYTSNKGDDNLRYLLLKIYKFTRSCPNPKEWLEEKTEIYNPEINNDIYLRYIIKYAKNEVENAIGELQALYDEICENELAGKYIDVIYDDILGLKHLYTQTQNWDMFYNALNNFEFKRANGVKDMPEDLRSKINAIRKSVKTSIKDELKENLFVANEEEIFSDNGRIYSLLKAVCDLVNQLDEKFYEKKSERGILDFSDVAHFALRILAENEDIANIYKEQFAEILIDEYQDSNDVQELILNAVSNGEMFMVGDVKQSIYRFRQARPELFLDKYTRYKNASEDDKNDCKITLFENFRSNNNIIRQANYIFEHIMSKQLGELDYTEDEFLKFGADCYPNDGEKAELNLIETQITEDSTDEIDDELLFESNANLEGRFIANKIKEMVGTFDVYDKKTKAIRKAQYKDFVILLRSTVGKIDAFVEELSNANIPFYTENSGEYFENTEVQTILSLLRIIDNPLQDIPLVAVLRSQIGGFSVDELSTIRICDKNCSFYDAMQKTLNLENELSLKIKSFLNKLYDWRNKSKYLSLWELLWDIYNSTGYYYYVLLFPDGIKRQANLKLLLDRAEAFGKSSFKGLFNFLNFIDNIKYANGDLSDSKTIGENEDVVRIMSVHKSKGLEFPVVFLAGAEKTFNNRESADDIIMNQDMGFGLNVIDFDSRIKYPFVSKHAVGLKNKMDSRSEEVRILYVALTRAREKLIVTGIVKDAQKTLEKYTRPATRYNIMNGTSFLDWIGYTVVDKSPDWTVNVIPHTFEDSTDEVESFESTQEIIVSKESELYKNIDAQMKWGYKYESSTKIPNKVSISELKRKALLENLEEPNFDTENLTSKLISSPNFVEDNSQSGASYGTLMHETLQKLDFNNYSLEKVKEILHLYTKDEFMVNIISNRIERFSRTELFNSIKNARSVKKEQSFNLNLNANEVYDVDTDDVVMIQGIIDLFFVNSNGELILVDYKTDNVETEEELIKRYKLQLNLYKRALEEILSMPVSRTIIYSFKLEKEIDI